MNEHTADLLDTVVRAIVIIAIVGAVAWVFVETAYPPCECIDEAAAIVDPEDV